MEWRQSRGLCIRRYTPEDSRERQRPVPSRRPQKGHVKERVDNGREECLLSGLPSYRREDCSQLSRATKFGGVTRLSVSGTWQRRDDNPVIVMEDVRSSLEDRECKEVASKIYWPLVQGRPFVGPS